jgi:hypothetical protein
MSRGQEEREKSRDRVGAGASPASWSKQGETPAELEQSTGSMVEGKGCWARSEQRAPSREAARRKKRARRDKLDRGLDETAALEALSWNCDGEAPRRA